MAPTEMYDWMFAYCQLVFLHKYMEVLNGQT